MTNLYNRNQMSMTYRAKLPQIDTDFYDYIAKEDERAAERLDMYLSSLLHHRASLLQQRGSVDTSLGKSMGRTPCGGGSCATASAEATAGGALRISAACRKLINSFKEKLGPGRPQVLLPADLTPRLARNIVRMVEGEDRGIRGCAIIVLLHDGPDKANLGKIVCDPTCPTTTTLHLHLNRVDDPHSSISRSGSSNSTSSSSSSSSSISRNNSSSSNDSISESTTCSNSRSRSKIIFISPGYTLEKRRKTRTKRRVNGGSSTGSGASSTPRSTMICKTKDISCQ